MPTAEANVSQQANTEDTSRLALLYEVAEQVNSSLELDVCLDHIIDGAYRIFQAEKVSLMLLDEAASELRMCAARNIPEDVIAKIRVPLGEGLAGKVAESGEAIVVSDMDGDPRFQRRQDAGYQTNSFAIIPLKHKDSVLGVINLTNRSDGSSFSEGDLALLAALANQAAIAIRNSQLITQINREKEDLRRAAFAATVLNQVSSSIRYGMGYQHLIEVLYASLDKLVDCDALCSLLVLQGDEDFQTKVLHEDNHPCLADARVKLLDDLATCPHTSVVSRRIEELRKEMPAPEPDGRPIRSTIGVPLEVGGQAVGMIQVLSCSENAFAETDVELLHSIVNQIAETVQRLQATIRGEQEKMQSMVASMSEGVIMFDANDELVVLNPKAREMLDLSEDEEFTTQGLFSSVMWNDIGSFLAERVEDDARYEEFLVEGDPEPTNLRVALAPVLNTRGERLGRLAVMHDVTRERELERMKSDFVAVVSHELRTPLTSIKMFTSNLMDGVEGEVNDGQRETLARMLKNLERLQRLINDLLDLSKLEAGKMKIQLAPLTVTEALESLSDVFGPWAETKGVTLNVDAEEGLPTVWADSDRLDQVLANLLGNALKFTPDGGSITVKASRHMPDPTEQIGAPGQRSPLSGEGYLCVSVTDTGHGIPADDLGRVFDKFYQTDHSLTRKTGGTGLGLPICREIIAKHGGRIWAESEIGHGATFSFEVPIDARTHDRTQLRSTLEREIRRARRYGLKFSVLMLDIDDFTEVNREHGLEGGDVALLELQDMVRDEVKKFLSARIRDTDICGRYGGDEFLVVAPETDEAGAHAFAERLRGLIEERSFIANDKAIRTTVSIGVTAFQDEDIAPIGLVRRSAAALGDAKTSGKNVVCSTGK
jgi:diguanylate cyclase (GGDEF)-like protein